MRPAAVDVGPSTMKFADKYEILEMVTSGRVSTFLARERTTQEPVVVYTFECVGAGELSTASIIARFCALAPNPPGMIVKAGFDAPSSSAFLTTRMPESTALKAWVGAYQSFARPGTTPRPAGGAPTGDETAELSASEVRAVMARSGTPAKQPPIENLSEDMGSPDRSSSDQGSSDLGGGTAAFSLSAPTPDSPQSAGEFTRLFNEVNAFQPTPSSKPPAAPVAAKPVAPKPSNPTDAMFGELLGASPLGGKPAAPAASSATLEPPPGSFTREFLGLSTDKTPTPEVVPRTPPAPKFTPPAEKEPGAFTREFMAVSQDVFKTAEKPSVPPAQKTAPSPATSFDSIFGGSASESSTPASGGEQKAGEFTSFFCDPFESPGALAKPIDIPELERAAPTKPPVGDFTRMFGREDLGREEPAPLPALEPEPSAAAGSFTQMFGEVPAAKRSQESQLGAATLGTNPNVRPSFLESSGVQDAPPAPPRGVTPATPPEPFFSPASSPTFSPKFSSPPASPATNQTFMGRPGSTTDVFRIPGGDAPPVEQLPSGPSEFTVFLSRNQLNESFAAAGGAPAGSVPPPAPPPGPFQFAPPPAPAPPAVKFPPAPAPPAAPAVAAPAAAPKLASFWPLIVVLTVLFAIGALMVMYFALKH